jgi:hypothetical protein
MEFVLFFYCDVKRRVILVGVTTDYGIYGREQEFNSRQDQVIFICPTASGVGLTELPTQAVRLSVSWRMELLLRRFIALDGLAQKTLAPVAPPFRHSATHIMNK